MPCSELNYLGYVPLIDIDKLSVRSKVVVAAGADHNGRGLLFLRKQHESESENEQLWKICREVEAGNWDVGRGDMNKFSTRHPNVRKGSGMPAAGDDASRSQLRTVSYLIRSSSTFTRSFIPKPNNYPS